METPEVSRRTFVKGMGALGGLCAAGSALAVSQEIVGDYEPAYAESEEKVIWNHCAVNCGHCCTHRFHMKDDVILYTETDNTGSPDINNPQARACLRGRSIRRWLQSDTRLNYPMKRVGARGEGKFERITWEEALDTIASELTRIREKYGNEAVYFPQATGVVSSKINSNPVLRLLALNGGYLNKYGTFSSAQIREAAALTYGKGISQYGSNFCVFEPNQLVVLFGASVGDAQVGGSASAWRLVQQCEEKHCRVISIDTRRSDTLCNFSNIEWIPIRPGTDAALIAALAHEIIVNGWTDDDFLAKYCIGYTDDTMPEEYKGKNMSYKDYILGTGYDMVEKTPEWASEITQIPVERIKTLAEEIAMAKPVYIAQGLGIQRRANGELNARSVMVLPQLLGQLGIPGTNDGRQIGVGASLKGSMSVENPVKTSISFFTFPKAIKEGPSMTALKDGVRGADALQTGIKFMFNYAGNSLTNQNSNINAVHDILVDESLCEFIVSYDVVMNDSQKYADILLPDLTIQEQYDIAGNGYVDPVRNVQFGSPIYSPKFERRGVYDVCCELAKRLGIYDEFTDGKETREDWLRAMYEEARAAAPDLPTYEEGFEMGIWHGELTSPIASQKFRDDPEGNPLKTESGKIQIFSPTMAERAETWEISEGDELYPIPAYSPGFNSYLDVDEKHPLMIYDFQYKSRAHSCYSNNEILDIIAPCQLWINPEDAKPRGIEDGDEVRVYTDEGEIRIRAKVTDRIIPGSVALPEGSNHEADMNGDRVDRGGCINTLTTSRPSPISFGNPQKSNVGQVEKVKE